SCVNCHVPLCYNSENCKKIFQNNVPKCPGYYCGRIMNGDVVNDFTCTACQRGYKSDGWVCVPCDEPFDLYSIFYLIFMQGSVLVIYFYTTDTLISKYGYR